MPKRSEPSNQITGLPQKTTVNANDRIYIADSENAYSEAYYTRDQLIPRWHYFGISGDDVPSELSASNIVECWNFGSTGSPLTGIKNNIALTANTTVTHQLADGLIQGILFDGTTQVLWTQDTTLQITGALTVEYLYRAAGGSSNKCYIAWVKVANTSYSYYIGEPTGSANEARISYYGDSGAVTNSSEFYGKLQTGCSQVVLLTVTRNASPSTSINYYVNGVYLGTTQTAPASPSTGSGTPGAYNNIFCIGSQTTGSAFSTFMGGVVCGVRLWNIQMTAAQVYSSYRRTWR